MTFRTALLVRNFILTMRSPLNLLLIQFGSLVGVQVVSQRERLLSAVRGHGGFLGGEKLLSFVEQAEERFAQGAAERRGNNEGETDEWWRQRLIPQKENDLIFNPKQQNIN